MENQDEPKIIERVQEPLLVAGIHWKGKYQNTGTYFTKLGKAARWKINGRPMNLYFDRDFKEGDAEVESCFPIRKNLKSRDVKVESLPGGKFITLIHKGSYESLKDSYKKIFTYLNSKGIKPKLPMREVYLKGPGMIFMGNPKNYVTEIQIPID